ncbi:MAG: hypothetical protein AAF354_04075 [Pseudomonadota bacterium]
MTKKRLSVDRAALAPWIVAGALAMLLLAGILWLLPNLGYVGGDSKPPVKTRASEPPQGGLTQAMADPDRAPVASSRRVVGRVRCALGPREATVTIKGPNESRLRTQTDEQGRYETTIPLAWSLITVDASASGGYHGKKRFDIGLERGARELEILMMHRTVRLTLKIECDPDAHALVKKWDGRLALSAIMKKPGAKKTAGLLQAKSTETIAQFAWSDGPVQQSAQDLTIQEKTEIVWVYYPQLAYHTEIARHLIPEEQSEVEVVCRITTRNLLLGQVQDASGQPVSNLPLEVFSEGTGQLLSPRTSKGGEFCVLVPENGFGSVGVSRGDCPPKRWNAGVPANIVCDFSDWLRVKVVDENGTPVTVYGLSLRNNATRTNDGTINEHMRLASVAGGVQVAPFGALQKGQLIYVLLPGAGEYVHVCPESIALAPEPYAITVGDATHGTVTVRLINYDESKDRQIVNLHLIGQGLSAAGQRNEYRFSLLPGVSGPEWVAYHILPGHYDYVITTMGNEWGRGSVTVADGSSALIEVTL